MTEEEIKKYVNQCPHSDKSIDATHTCDLEFHYRKIRPTIECLCAKKFGLKSKEKMEQINLSTPKMSNEEIIDTLKGLVFGSFDRTTSKEREAVDMVIKELEQNNTIHIKDVFRLIAGHSDYHGDDILSAFQCLAEGKDVEAIRTLN